MPFAVTWLDLEIIILNEISQTEKYKYHMISLICEIQKNDTNELIYKAEIDSQIQKTNSQLPKGREVGMNQEFGINRYTLLYVKQITNMDLLYSTENTTQYFIITYKGKNLKKNRYVYMYNGITLLYT